ncbi:ABC transporter ATP-binding protein [Streptomyces sp. HNM0574]|uniref:ABC transporter ATP-binding protein n=1 Tax=Streptomyces sp. HNM0574 TaxID=2714954 RepID=UPI00146A289A|nr:ABC transporter ATP-binding protein [Streptomyces sp. HNM0574]NLU68745.1 ABC transporter ATP-binding protein [Streptomyces sp. HNM0574]
MQIRDLPYADPGTPDVRSGFRFLLWLGRSQIGGQLRALAWGVVHMGSVAALPVAAGIAVEAAVARSGTQLARAGLLLAVIAVTVSVGDTLLHRAAITNWITSAARTQQLLARRTAALGAALTRRVAAGEVVAVSTGDIEKIGWCVEATSRFSSALLVTLGVCGGLVLYQPQLGVLVSIGVLVLALCVLPLLPPATRRADTQRDKAGRATELAADTVAGLRVLRGIGGEELFLTRYRNASQEVRRAAVRTARMWALIAAVQVALPGLLLVGVVWRGTGLALAGEIGVGELVTVYGAVTFLLFPLRMFQEFAMAYSFSRPSAKRAARVLALRRETAGDSGTVRTPEPASPRAEEGTPAQVPESALRGDLFDPASGLLVPAGTLTAVVCGDPDTAGTLAERLGGHPPGGNDEESVRLGHVPLDAVTLDAARSAVLVQDKDPVLLSGTLGELLDVPTSGAVTRERALEAAQCDDVLQALLQGSPDAAGDPLAARITERGRSLSGGQRQRLSLARSLITDPPVLVLDEPTSAVDTHTEARIARSVERLREGRTTVVITSSPLLLARAQHVVFLPDGKATASGTHRELLESDGAYRAAVTRDATSSAPSRINGDPQQHRDGESAGAPRGAGEGEGAVST